MADIVAVDKQNSIIVPEKEFSKKWEYGFFYLYVFLALFHIPIFWFGDDSVGLFDVYQVIYLMILLFRFGNDRIVFPRYWSSYFIVVLLYISYLLLGYVTVVKAYNTILLMKQVQYFVGFFIVLRFFDLYSEDYERIILTIQKIFLSMVIFQLMRYFHLFEWFGLQKVLGYGSEYRLGLPFKLGTSSNPAGFVLGIYLLFSWEYILRRFKRNLLSKVTFILAALALFLTISRTNILSFIIVIMMSMIIRVLREHGYLKYFIIFLIVVIVIFIIALRYIPKSNRIWTFLKLVENPSSILRDSSFNTRYTMMWVTAFNNWLKNPFTLFFGTGVGDLQWVDGTIPRLLGNQGLVGLCLFMYVWIGYFVWRFPKNRILFLLLMFILVSGLNAETLIISFRTVQIYMVLLGMFVYSGIASKNRQETEKI